MISVIQVGTGLWGRSWAVEALPSVNTIEVTAYVDADERALAVLRQCAGVPTSKCFTSLSEALKSAPCDIVLATLRTEAHFNIVHEALSADRHVLVEKPFTVTLEEAQILNLLAVDRGRLLMVSQNYRFYRAPRTVASLIAENRFGRVDSVAVDFRRDAPSMRFQYFDAPDPLLVDTSIHHFDLMRMLFGEVARVSCRTWNRPGSPFRYDPTAFATVEFVSGLFLSFRGSLMSIGVETPMSGLWTIECSDAVINWACRGKQDSADNVTDWVQSKSLDEPAVDLPLVDISFYDRAGTIAALAEAVESGIRPRYFSSGEDNLKSLALMETCVLSAKRQGAWVEPAELLSY